MVAGLKRTSSPIQISSTVSETVGGTFAFEQIDLTLNALDNEVFVITQVNIDVNPPDIPNAVNDQNFSSASLSTTQRTSVGSIANTNVIAQCQRYIGGGQGGAPVAFDREDPLFSAQDMDYLAIVATNNMFLNVQGEGSQFAGIKTARCRVYGYRAQASAAQYAALVQSELLSA